MKNRKQTRYWVCFSFQTKEGRAVRKSHTVSKELYQTLRAGQQREVEYLAGDPTESRLFVALESRSTFDIAMGGVLAVLAGAGAFSFGYFGWRTATRQARLTLEGQAVRGQVIELVVRKGKATTYELHYCFVDPMGTEHAAEKLTLPIKAPTDWQPGEPIAVLVDELDPSQFVPDVYRQRGDDLP